MRYTSIDLLRTVAIALMVMVHFVENLSGLGNFAPGGYAAPLFTFLSGVSYQLWVSGQEARGRKDGEISKVTVRRGLFIFAVGFLFNVFVWLPEDTYNWDILTFIGAALVFLNLVRKLPGPIAILICVLVFAISPVLRAVTDYSAYWTLGYFKCDLTLSEVTLGFLVNGFFPIFPWIVYPIAGFVVASRLFPESRRSAGTVRWLTIMGIGLFAAYGAATLLRPYSPTLVQDIWLKGWTMFPASAEYMLGTLGMALSALVAAHLLIDKSPRFDKESQIARITSTFSTHSFTIYILHHVVHLWPLWLYGLATSDDPTTYWMQALPPAWSWPLSFVFLFVCYFFLRFMEHARLPGMETIMRWLCD